MDTIKGVIEVIDYEHEEDARWFEHELREISGVTNTKTEVAEENEIAYIFFEIPKESLEELLKNEELRSALKHISGISKEELNSMIENSKKY